MRNHLLLGVLLLLLASHGSKVAAEVAYHSQNADSKISDVSAEYVMPGDIDMDDDAAISRILNNGFIYTVKTEGAYLLNIDKSKQLSRISKGKTVFYDNAIRRFKAHPYIWVKTTDNKLAGWIHVKFIGYKAKK